MIPISQLNLQGQNWKREYAESIKKDAQLIQLLGLPPNTATFTAENFALRVPLSFAHRMRQGDLSDPLLLQVLPQPNEGMEMAGFSADPVGDQHALASPGLLHKYHGRALLLVSAACPIHCRYCFRRHFDYSNAGHWREALPYILADTSLTEIILSGGDPLSLDDEQLAEVITALEAIPHVRRLRIHTRMPIVIPSRVTSQFIAHLRQSRLRCIIVVHCNHANELDPTCVSALQSLRTAGVTVLNQAVLLNKINDNASDLINLSESLFAAGVLPYYLHVLDRVAGAAHFEVDEIRARQLHQILREQLPGYLVPRLVRETRGAAAKLPID